MTPRLGHKPIPMRLRESVDEIEAVGDFVIDERPSGNVFIIAIPYVFGMPRDGRLRYVLSEWTIDHKNRFDAQWSWDGNREKPSLTPSLHAVNIWHGWVKEGKLIES